MRWLTHSCENPKDGKYKWKQMIEFLEKEITVQQHKTVIETNLNMSNLGKDNRDGRNKGDKGKSTYHSQTPNNRPSQDPICFICGANDHVQTNGPNNTKLVQYHSCKQFVDMTTSQRLKFLNDNGLCHQCLYPGAQISRGKHSEGKCQHKKMSLSTTKISASESNHYKHIPRTSRSSTTHSLQTINIQLMILTAPSSCYKLSASTNGSTQSSTTPAAVTLSVALKQSNALDPTQSCIPQMTLM